MSESASLVHQSTTIMMPARTQQTLWLRLLQGLTVAAVVIASIACVIYLVAVVQWRSQTFPGFLTAHSLVVDGHTSFSNQEWPGLAAGLRRMDHIVAINGAALPENDFPAAREQFVQALADVNYGEQVSVTLWRQAVLNADGMTEVIETGNLTCGEVDEARGAAQCTVTYVAAPMPDSDFLTYFVFPYITGVIALAIGIAILFLRPGQVSTLLTTLLCMSLAVFSAGVFNNSTTYFALPLWVIATTLGAAIMFTFALTFPTRPALLYRYPALLAIVVLAFAGVAAYEVYAYRLVTSPLQFTTLWQLPVGLGILGYITLLATLLVRRRFATSSIHLDQINTILVGLAIPALPITLWVVSAIAIAVGSTVILPFNSATIMPFFVALPISFAYAVLQYRGLNTDRVLSQGITYGLMLFGLVVGYAVLVFGVNLLALEFMPTNVSGNPFLVGVVVFFIAVAFLPFRTRLQTQVDRIYFRERRAYQEQIENFARDVAVSQDFTEILSLYISRVQRALNARAVFVFLPNDEGSEFVAHALSQPQTEVRFETRSDLIELLKRQSVPIRISQATAWQPELIAERGRLNILKAHLLASLRGSRSQAGLNGFVVVGPPQTGLAVYSYEEIRFLENITNQMAISVERSRVVESLERRVNELDVLSQVSQAVNFAVEFDDLLELISNQTQRLIEVSHFYIVLRDTATNQMYYAFFLEADERLRDQENRRWNMGNDLFASILENGQPERHDDYNTTVKIQNLNSRGISEDVRAWMGVPLVAGQSYLGVVAVATTLAGYTYTDEQLKVFRDIGSLAATSLDKARLFEETNQRARQLRALNKISQQLQAERNVERLLELITSSAVEILEAEAGSLLLTVEDDLTSRPGRKRDLEFQVVIGGSGADLIGKRVPAGQGLVGEVAALRKPVIVNNTHEDERWQGEVSSDTEFSTNAVLAVPLMANNDVIGVLEVLNKQDGGLYVKEDADVLETFAGQAAIILENARLFQKTDEQLDKQVRELETLERIDTELNRALDMRRVAEITVKWAIANSGASAGLLGLVNTDFEPPYLDILAIYGYDDDDYPEGADGLHWPLDRGIVNRVLRTKRADAQPDTAIDPDYVASLRGGSSQITVPMLAGGEIIAILLIEKYGEPRLNILDQAFVQRLADHAAIALENARLYSELSQASKLQSRMMGVGAHELNNALTPVKAWSDFLLNGAFGEVNEQQKNSLGVIKSNVGRAELIISDLRDFAKMRANELLIKPEPIHFRNVVVETLRPFTSQIEEKDQTLDNSVSEDLPLVNGDFNRLIQVMTNFVSNANKYSPNGATITLNAVVERDRVVKGEVQGDFLHVTVADDGIGISKEDQKQMFQPYFRSTNEEAQEQPGTGLGMSLTREIILKHGGDVWVESELGDGSTFHFTIPLAPEEERASEPASD